jgi:D-amino-acid dehydrogenase
MTATKADVIVIGAGAVGISCAYYAAASGARVLVLERNGVAAGSSYGNAGLLVPGHCEPLSSPGVVAAGLRELFNPEGAFHIHPRPDVRLARWLLSFRHHCNDRHYARALEIHAMLNRESISCHKQLGEQGGSSYGMKMDGLLCLYTKEESFQEAQKYIQRVRPLGIEFRVLSAAEVMKMESSIREPIIGGTLGVGDGWLNPNAFVHWLATQAEARGVEIAKNTEVFGFDTNRHRVNTVITTRGRIQADQVVIAAGAWTPRLTRLLHTGIPIESGKGYSITFKQPAIAPKRPLMLEEARIAVTPFGDAVRFAGTLEMAGLDPGINRRRVEAIERNGKQSISGADGWELEEIWSGLRPCTPDGLPILGRLGDFDNVFIAGGHATKGISQGPGTGRLLADLLAGSGIGPLEPALSPRRFRAW